MITCTHCGKLTYEGFGSCQYCGTPFSGKVGGGSGIDPKMSAPEQPELPAWLESLRAGDKPVGSTGEQFNYATDGTVDKNALPNWMRPESAEHISADQYAVRRSAAQPAPNTDGGAITAGSLIDEGSLPSWLQENQSASDPSAQRNISAASLVQPDALPQWMRTPQEAALASAPTRPPVEPAIPPQGIAANSLIDPQAMPAWMSGQGRSNDLTPTGGNMAAGSLLDMNALPNWLRESEQGQEPVRVEINPPAHLGQPTPSATNGNLAAPSLVDMNALPEWLRAGADQGYGGQGGRPQQGTPVAAPAARALNVPPRVENVRVPSRPRGDVGPREQSQAAANVFASMLGVASPVPNFPPQAQGNMPGSPYPRPSGQLQTGGVPAGARPGVAGPPTMPTSPAGYQAYQGGYSMLGVQQPGAPQQAMNRQMEPNARMAKRGFLETIRGWFSR